MAETQHAPGWMRAMAAFLVLCNPLVPVHLRRHTWHLIDLVVAANSVALAFALRSKRGAKSAAAKR